MTSRQLSSGIAAITLLDAALHHFPGRVLLELTLLDAACLALIWFPEDINDLTVGTWWRGYQINAPTPAIFIAGFGWVCLIALSVALLVAFHAPHRH